MKKKEINKLLLEKLQYTLDFDTDGPFFDMVIAFFIASLGAKPIMEDILPDDMPFKELTTIIFDGKAIPGLTVNPLTLFKVFEKKKQVHLGIYLSSICSMLIIFAYESNKQKCDSSPICEFFRHIRNACAHNNSFFFTKNEPRRPAKWRNFKINHKKKGEQNPLFGKKCFSDFLGPADAVILLNEIEMYWKSRPNSGIT
jgi:hypothetical protein